MPTLSYNSTGRYVREMQNCLDAYFHFYDRVPNPPLSLDGIFGSQTEAAVERFQRENGLSADGIVGPQTWYQLEDLYCAG